MLNQKDKGYLLNIVGYCDRVNEIILKISKKDFDNSIDYKEIICFNILQVGELSGKLSNELINKYDKVPWKAIKNMRNKIVHEYGAIDFDIIWETAKLNIKDLGSYCKLIIKKEA